MAKRPYLVLPGGICVPLEGPYRIEMHRGHWYVLGRNQVLPCDSEALANVTLQRVLMEHDAHALAEEALFDDSLGQIPESVQRLSGSL
jgi:hypothetical protein